MIFYIAVFNAQREDFGIITEKCMENCAVCTFLCAAHHEEHLFFVTFVP